MRDGSGLISGIAAGRPVMASTVIAVGLTALAAAGFRNAPNPAIADAFATYAAFAAMTAVPSLVAAAAPQNFWVRFVYSAAAGGLLIAVRRITEQRGWTAPPLDLDLALVWTAAATVFLSVGAPLWRAATGNSAIGLSASIVGLAAALGLSNILGARGALSEEAGPAIALAMGLAAAIAALVPVQFAKSATGVADSRSAAAQAARAAIAPLLHAVLIAFAAFGVAAFSKGAAIFQAAYLSVAFIGLIAMPSLVMGAGANSKRIAVDISAENEVRRRLGLVRILDMLRTGLPATSALAAVALLGVLMLVVGFETRTPLAPAEIAAILGAGLFALIVFVSVRTALLVTAALAVAARLSVFLYELTGATPPSVEARLVAEIIAAVLLAWLFLAWRDNRNPRLKTREVTERAVEDAYFAYAAATVFALSAIAASEAGGLWPQGVASAMFAMLIAIIGALVAPPLMTAVGALFGRD